MAKAKPKDNPESAPDPFDDVDARSITDIEQDQKVRLQREALPAAAKLTDLPLPWVIATLILCIAVSELAQRVESRHLIERAESANLIEPEQAEQARRGEELVQRREEIQRRMEEVRERQRDLRRLTEPRDGAPAPDEEVVSDDPTIPLTLEALRGKIRSLAGDSFESYRRFGTLIALLVGAFGLILMAVFVRALAAALLGGIGFAAGFFIQLEPWIMWSVAGVGALIGFLLAPRLLLANMLFNVALAGMVLGGVAVGGGVYLATVNELYAIFGLGVGVVAGAFLGFKFSRQLFLCAVLVNAAWVSTLVLWLFWGDLYPHFWPITFGGLMIVDAVATRIYHKVRWQR